MPAKVDKLFDEVKSKNPSYSDEQAWATAWSIYCKHVNPGSKSCHKPTSEYLKGKSASFDESDFSEVHDGNLQENLKIAQRHSKEVMRRQNQFRQARRDVPHKGVEDLIGFIEDEYARYEQDAEELDTREVSWDITGIDNDGGTFKAELTVNPARKTYSLVWDGPSTQMSYLRTKRLMRPEDLANVLPADFVRDIWWNKTSKFASSKKADLFDGRLAARPDYSDPKAYARLKVEFEVGKLLDLLEDLDKAQYAAWEAAYDLRRSISTLEKPGIITDTPPVAKKWDDLDVAERLDNLGDTLKEVRKDLNEFFPLVQKETRVVERPPATVLDAPATAAADPLAFNTVLSRLLQKLKRDAGADAIRQNYRGTGRQVHRRQLWVNFKSGAVIDLWLENNRVEFGGVVRRGPPANENKALQKGVAYGTKSPEQVYKEVAAALKEWATP